MLDLDAISDWGAAAVVTLLEPEELMLLTVESKGQEVFAPEYVVVSSSNC